MAKVTPEIHEIEHHKEPSMIDFEIVIAGDDFPKFKNLIVGFNDEGGRGISFTKFFTEKLELKPLVDVYINKPALFKSVHIIDGDIHSLFRLYGHGDMLIVQLDIPYDNKLDTIFTEILLGVYSKFKCEAMILLNSAPQDVEDFIPEEFKEMFLAKKMPPGQIEEIALQQMHREPTEDDKKFVYFSNSVELCTRIETAFGERATKFTNGMLGNMVGQMFNHSRTIPELNVVVMTSKYNIVRIDPDPVINMVDFIKALSDTEFELDTDVLREESDTYLHEVGGRMSHKLEHQRHPGGGNGMMYM